MKNLTILLLALCLIFAQSCKKEQITNINGPLVEQLTFVVHPVDWTNSSTPAGTAGAHVFALLGSSHLKFDSIGIGTVMVYIKQSDGTVIPLPYIYYNSAGTGFFMEYAWKDGIIDIHDQTWNYQYPTFSSDEKFIVVIIPGGYKTLPIDLNDYNAVKSYFHIKTLN